MNLKKIIKEIFIKIEFFYISESKNQLFLMNKNDLLLVGNRDLVIIDFLKKEIIKHIEYNIIGHISFMYRLSHNIILFGGWGNRIEQIEYDEIQRDIKIISNNNKSDYNYKYNNLYKITSISVFNNKLIVTPFENQLGNSSLIIYQIKYK